jgi:hypothetical protein
MMHVRVIAAALFLLAAGTGCRKQGAQEPPPQASVEEVSETAEPPEPRPAERLTPREGVKRRIEELFGLCEAGDLEKAAGYVVYRGDDPARRWKTVCTLGSEEEREAVAEVCQAISGLLSESDSYEFEDFETEAESEGTWYVWEVAFTRGGEKMDVAFAFLEVEGTYALGDID